MAKLLHKLETKNWLKGFEKTPPRSEEMQIAGLWFRERKTALN